MTFEDAVREYCRECRKVLAWTGFKGHEYNAHCCGYSYTLEPKVLEYDLVVSKQQLPDGVIPGKDGGLFWHPV